jgi:hypothetical protein
MWYMPKRSTNVAMNKIRIATRAFLVVLQRSCCLLFKPVSDMFTFVDNLNNYVNYTYKEFLNIPHFMLTQTFSSNQWSILMKIQIFIQTAICGPLNDIKLKSFGYFLFGYFGTPLRSKGVNIYIELYAKINWNTFNGKIYNIFIRNIRSLTL